MANVPRETKRGRHIRYYDKVKDTPEHKAKRKEQTALVYQKRKAKQAELKLLEQNQNQSPDDSSK